MGNGGNILFDHAWLEKCFAEDGYVFNPCFAGSGEDWELIWRLRKRGATMMYVPNPVTHLRRASLRQHCRHSFYRGAGIALLYSLYKADAGAVVVQDSLLWGRNGIKSKPRWARAFWEKIVGPFDMKSFKKTWHFCIFWVGEKCQAMGFLWGIIRLSKAGELAAGRLPWTSPATKATEPPT